MIIGEDILQVRDPALNFYLLDGGFIGGRYLLRRALLRHGWHREPIKGIIVTHGHLDHILNIAAHAEESGAWVAAPRLDLAHYEGRYPYRGQARITGWLEAVGKPLLGYRKFKIDRFLDDQSDLPSGTA